MAPWIAYFIYSSLDWSNKSKSALHWDCSQQAGLLFTQQLFTDTANEPSVRRPTVSSVEDDSLTNTSRELAIHSVHRERATKSLGSKGHTAHTDAVIGADNRHTVITTHNSTDSDRSRVGRANKRGQAANSSTTSLTNRQRSHRTSSNRRRPRRKNRHRNLQRKKRKRTDQPRDTADHKPAHEKATDNREQKAQGNSKPARANHRQPKTQTRDKEKKRREDTRHLQEEKRQGNSAQTRPARPTTTAEENQGGHERKHRGKAKLFDSFSHTKKLYPQTLPRKNHFLILSDKSSLGAAEKL
jgi:hypothetical protein